MRFTNINLKNMILTIIAVFLIWMFIFHQEDFWIMIGVLGALAGGALMIAIVIGGIWYVCVNVIA